MFNTGKTFLLVILTVCSVSFSVAAEKQGYRQANDITEQEWDMVQEKKYEYNNCLKEKMFGYVENGTDARQVADQVLEVCSFHLTEMQKNMDGNNIQPEFTQRFIYNVKNKAARKMLSGIMMLMAQQQARLEEEKSAAGSTLSE